MTLRFDGFVLDRETGELRKEGALVRRIRSSASSEFSNYRKFTVDTQTDYEKRKP